MAIAKAKGHSSEKAARRYIKDFGYVHGIGAEPDDVDAFYADCIQNLPDGRQEVWRAGRDFYPSSSESGSDNEADGFGNVSGDDDVDEVGAKSLPPFAAGSSIATALKEMGIEDEVASEWSDSEESDAAQEMTVAEYNDQSAGATSQMNAAPQACDKCARCGQHGHLTRDCVEMVCGNCRQQGHLAKDCPKPAACFRCGALDHWVKDCPKPSWWQRGSNLLRNTETRWVPFHAPTIKKELHHCAVCDYKTNVLTKASRGMPRHKAFGQWCRGSGQAPGRSETLHETEDPSVRVYTWGACDAILDGKAPRHAVRFCSME